MTEIKAAIIGHILGDAMGLPFQFKSRSWLNQHPVNSMVGYLAFNKPSGSFSDDASMSLALLDSLSHGYQREDIMDKFVAWLMEGKYTQEGQAFDMGQTTSQAILSYNRGISIDKCGGKSYYDNGNGSLMRILPLLFYLRDQYGSTFIKQPKAIQVIHEVSALTHGHPIALMACGLYLSIANQLLNSVSKFDAVQIGLKQAFEYYDSDSTFIAYRSVYDRLRNLDDFSQLPIQAIKSSGYVVDTLEASLWCLLTSHTYQACIIKAVNLGDDTDTVAAIAGGLAGLYYGYDDLPPEWINAIHHRELVDTLIEQFEHSLKKSV